MAGHEVQYGGVRLIGILTSTVESIPVRDDSGTDQWYVETTVEVSTVVNVAVFAAANQTIGALGHRVQGDSAAATCRNLQSLLGEDRKPFAYIQDGVTIFESDNLSDANNGPKVVHIRCKPAGKNSISISFAVKIAKVGCSENPPPVIGNRWSVSDTIDDQHRTVRTWRGKLRVCNAVHDPHAWRELAVPRLSDGFRRVRLHFHGELNALELSYEIVDQQMLGDAAPHPALRMSGTHTETLSQSGAFSIGEVYVRLDGGPGTDRQVLVEQCMRVINSRIQADRFAVNAKNWIWKELIITDYFGEDVCAVDARARVQRSLTEEDAKGGFASLRLGNMVLGSLATPLDLGGDYSRFRTIPPNLYPCTTAGLFSAALSCPCCDHQMPQVGATIDGSGEVTRSEDEATSVTYDPSGAQFEISSPGYSNEQTEAMYSYANVEWIVDIDEGYVQLPYGDQLPRTQNTVAMIRLHAPTAKVTAKAAFERVGEWPVIPQKRRFTDAAGIIYTPLKYKVNRRPPEFQGDGSVMHVVDLDAVFAMSRAPNEGEFLAPSLPWDNLEPTVVPSQSFVPLFANK